MAYLNTDGLPSSEPPMNAAPAPAKPPFWTRGRLIGGGMLALVVAGGAGWYALTNRNAAHAGGFEGQPYTLSFTSATALRGDAANPATRSNAVIRGEDVVTTVAKSTTGVTLSLKGSPLDPDGSSSLRLKRGGSMSVKLTNQSKDPITVWYDGWLQLLKNDKVIWSDKVSLNKTLESGKAEEFSTTPGALSDVASSDYLPAGDYTYRVNYRVGTVTQSVDATITLTDPDVTNPVTISSIEPTTPAPGSQITIHGTGFDRVSNTIYLSYGSYKNPAGASTSTRWKWNANPIATKVASTDGQTLTATLPVMTSVWCPPKNSMIAILGEDAADCAAGPKPLPVGSQALEVYRTSDPADATTSKPFLLTVASASNSPSTMTITPTPIVYDQAAAVTTAPTLTPTTLLVSPAAVRAGDTVVLSGSSFKPSPVTYALKVDDKVLPGTQSSSTDGATLVFAIPSSVTAGVHQLGLAITGQAGGTQPTDTINLTVLDQSSPPITVTLSDGATTGTYTSPAIPIDKGHVFDHFSVSTTSTALKYQVATDVSNYVDWRDVTATISPARKCPTTASQTSLVCGNSTGSIVMPSPDVLKGATAIKLRVNLSGADSFTGFSAYLTPPTAGTGTAATTATTIPAPTISAISPALAKIGDTVKLTGTGFTKSNNVHFGDSTVLSAESTDGTTLTFVVPAQSGNSRACNTNTTYSACPMSVALLPMADGDYQITVSNANGTTATSQKLTISATGATVGSSISTNAAPTLTKLAPLSVVAGGTVTLEGTGLDDANTIVLAKAGSNDVPFHGTGTKTSQSFNTNSTLAAGDYLVSVTNSRGTTNQLKLTVTAPSSATTSTTTGIGTSAGTNSTVTGATVTPQSVNTALTPASGPAPLVASVTSGKTSYSGGAMRFGWMMPIQSESIDWGDGTTTKDTTSGYLRHRYLTAGSYAVKRTIVTTNPVATEVIHQPVGWVSQIGGFVSGVWNAARSAFGQSNTTTATSDAGSVVVTAMGTPPAAMTLPSGFSLSATSGTAPFKATLTVPAAGRGLGGYVINWGDDQQSYGVTSTAATTSSYTYNYMKAGTYTVAIDNSLFAMPGAAATSQQASTHLGTATIVVTAGSTTMTNSTSTSTTATGTVAPAPKPKPTTISVPTAPVPAGSAVTVTASTGTFTSATRALLTQGGTSQPLTLLTLGRAATVPSSQISVLMPSLAPSCSNAFGGWYVCASQVPGGMNIFGRWYTPTAPAGFHTGSATLTVTTNGVPLTTTLTLR